MDAHKLSTMKTVRSTYAAWRAIADQVICVRATLAAHDPAIDAPVAELHAELRALQAESERLLALAQQALLSIKTPRSSNGDSTWG
jgi:hypothetical protein